MKWADMSFQTALKTAPSAEPLSYAEAKAWLRLPDDTEQTIVTAMIVTARQKVEADTGLKLITQAWYCYLDAFPDDAIRLPLAPLRSVTAIKTTTAAGVQSTVASTNYQVDIVSSPPRIVLSDAGSWPSDIRLVQGIEIEVSVGYGAAGSNCPSPLVDAMRQLLTMWYGAGRSMQGVLPPKWAGYDDLIRPYRLPGIA